MLLAFEWQSNGIEVSPLDNSFEKCLKYAFGRFAVVPHVFVSRLEADHKMILLAATYILTYSTATVSHITISVRCALKLIYIKAATVIDTDCPAPVTAVSGTAKACRPCHNPIVYCRVWTRHPSWMICITMVYGNARCCYVFPCSTSKTVPSFGQVVITSIWACRMNPWSISRAQLCVILTHVCFKTNMNEVKTL